MYSSATLYHICLHMDEVYITCSATTYAQVYFGVSLIKSSLCRVHFISHYLKRKSDTFVTGMSAVWNYFELVCRFICYSLLM